MINWVLSSVLLSCVGIGIYHLMRNHIHRIQYRRLILWTLLTGSIVLPLVFGGHASSLHHHAKAVPRTVEEFCHCSIPDGKDLVMFQANKAYDVLLSYGNALIWISIAIGMFLFIRMAIRHFRVVRFLRSADASKKQSFGSSYYELRTGKMGIGSIRLFRSYILLDSRFDSLDESEKSAVLRHEVSHLNQLNTWEILFLDLLKALWWMNPAFYYIRRELELLSEFQADEAAATEMGSSKRYAALLLRINTQPKSTIIQSIKGGALKKRIKRLVAQSPRRKFSTVIGFCLILISLVSVNAISGRAIEQQAEEICIYEAMQCEYQTTGQTTFCRTCTLEEIRLTGNK